MVLIKLQKAVHGKSAMALYKGDKITMAVYIYNNEFGGNEWANTKIVCHVEYTKSLSTYLDLDTSRDRIALTKYSDFMRLKQNLCEMDKTEID